jgi:RNA polymerase sigma-70 factor, ECF subfamily
VTAATGPAEPAGGPAAGHAGPVADPSSDAEVFAEHRPLLFTVAYEILGSAVDAEDVVQETYLRWSGRPEGPIDNPRAYLVRIATRQALNRTRTLARQREDYVGPWLPEPVLTAPDVVDQVLLAESVSLAMLVVLESLSPPERAVFVLREVFGYGYDEIAGAVDRSSAAVRQIAHRARAHVQARRPRFEPDRATVDAVRQKFIESMFSGDVQGLMDLLAPDVVLLSDGGGKASAARRPLNGADPVARFLVGLVRKGGQDAVIADIQVNGAPAWALMVDGVPTAIAQLLIEDGRVGQLFVIVNPDKLGYLTETQDLTLRLSNPGG